MKVSDSISVLIADDHALISDIIESFLTAEGSFETFKCYNLSGVVTSITDRQSPFDVVLLDLDMPGMNGIEGLKEAVQANAGGNVVLFSGHAQQSLVFRALELGARGYLPKTMSSKSLVNAIRFVALGEVFLPSTFLGRMANSDQKKSANGISPREMDVLRRVSMGETNKDIALALGLSEISVKMHVRSLCSKLGVTNRTQIALKAISSGLT